MAKKGGYIIDNIYQGGYSSLSPSYGDVFTGYRISPSELGAPTKPDTANQIQQVNQLLNQGIIPIEVQALSPEVFDQIPKQHFKEINQMAKITGAKISVHAPLIEPSGITQQGWSESNREQAEEQLKRVVEKSMDLGEKESVPITIHSAGIPGTEYKITEEGKKVERLIAIDQESGKMFPFEEEKEYIPGVRGETIRTPQERLEDTNKREWKRALGQAVYYKEGADRILAENKLLVEPLLEDLQKIKDPQEMKIKLEALHDVRKEAFSHVRTAHSYLENAQIILESLFHTAYKYGPKNERKFLDEASEEYGKTLPKYSNPFKESQALQGLFESLESIKEPPKTIIPITEFALDKSAQTIGNVAYDAYETAQKNKKTPPTINIENLYPGIAFSTGEEMEKLVLGAKKNFVETAMKKGVSESKAKEQADKLIGITLDVGHLNIARKKGFEDKDLLKEVEKMAKYVKHVHLTDNFGYSDSHLPPGMGNVPVKKIFEELEKTGFKGRTITEAGGFVQHFGISPYPLTLEAMGSPIYSMEMAPYWNQAAGFYQNYYSGLGATLPQVNYETIGAGFVQLPTELGGQRQGAQGGRMSGRPME